MNLAASVMILLVLCSFLLGRLNKRRLRQSIEEIADSVEIRGRLIDQLASVGEERPIKRARSVDFYEEMSLGYLSKPTLIQSVFDLGGVDKLAEKSLRVVLCDYSTLLELADSQASGIEAGNPPGSFVRLRKLSKRDVLSKPSSEDVTRFWAQSNGATIH